MNKIGLEYNAEDSKMNDSVTVCRYCWETDGYAWVKGVATKNASK
jgi:hypothetical protein